MKLGNLQCKSNFNRNQVLLLMIENITNQIGQFCRGDTRCTQKLPKLFLYPFTTSQLSVNGVGPTKPLTTSLSPTSKHSSHLREPSKGGRQRLCWHNRLSTKHWRLVDQLSIKSQNNRLLKTTAIGLGPILTNLQAFLGFPVETIMKADTKLTVVMCCHLFDQRYAAPSSGDFRQRPTPPKACGLSYRNGILLALQRGLRYPFIYLKKKSNFIFFLHSKRQEPEILRNYHHTLCVMCPVSHVRCQMLLITYHM